MFVFCHLCGEGEDSAEALADHYLFDHEIPNLPTDGEMFAKSMSSSEIETKTENNSVSLEGNQSVKEVGFIFNNVQFFKFVFC